jgi:hypothetical protein
MLGSDVQALPAVFTEACCDYAFCLCKCCQMFETQYSNLGTEICFS